MYIYYNKEVVIKFYKTLKFTGFTQISDQRKEELDIIVAKNIIALKKKTVGPLSLMTYVAGRLTACSNTIGLNNGDEKAYFFIKVVDPKLEHLAVHESAMTISEIKENCLNKFQIYDKNLIKLEKCYNERFQVYKPEELWGRDNLKR